MTTRDLQAVSDQLKQEALAVRKCCFYGGRMQDQALKGLAQTLAQHHQQQYDRLYQYLSAQQ